MVGFVGAYLDESLALSGMDRSDLLRVVMERASKVQNARDRKQRQETDDLIRKEISQLQRRLRTEAYIRLRAVSDAEWQAAVDQDDRDAADREQGLVTAGAPIMPQEAELEEARPWEEVMQGGTKTMNLSFEALRRTDADEMRLAAELAAQRGRAYEQELRIQATRLGRPDYRGQLDIGPEWARIQGESARDAAGIVRSHNDALARQIERIHAQTPTANRNTYAAQVRTWDAKRAEWKDRQIAQHTSLSARNQAQRDLYTNSGLPEGYAILVPGTAVCPICQGFLERGEVPLNVALANVFPVHPNCPHYWETYPLEIGPDVVLWTPGSRV